MEVRIRHEEQAEAKPFCECEFGELQSVIDTLKRWGGVCFGGDHYADMGAQIVLDESGAYAEIILSEGE